MSGKASRGTLPQAHTPPSVSNRTAAKTRKRLFAHQAMVPAIIGLHASGSVYGKLLAGDGPPVFLRGESNLPGASRGQVSMAHVEAGAAVRAVGDGFHGGHAHGRHGRHRKGQ